MDHRRAKEDRDRRGGTGRPQKDEVSLGYCGFFWPCVGPVFRVGGLDPQVLLYGFTSRKMAMTAW